MSRADPGSPSLLIFRDLLWSMVTKERKDEPRYYREFVETALTEKPRSPFGKVYGGVILGGKTFIEEVLQRLNDQDFQKKEISHRRALGSKPSDIDEIINLVCNQFKVSREKVQATSPYKG